MVIFGKFIENGTEKKIIKMLCFENSTCSQTLHDNALRYFFNKFKFRIKLLLIHFGNLLNTRQNIHLYGASRYLAWKSYWIVIDSFLFLRLFEIRN